MTNDQRHRIGLRKGVLPHALLDPASQLLRILRERVVGGADDIRLHVLSAADEKRDLGGNCTSEMEDCEPQAIPDRLNQPERELRSDEHRPPVRGAD